MNDQTKAKLEVATMDTEDIEGLKEELAKRKDEFEKVRLELDDMRNRSSTPGSVTPGPADTTPLSPHRTSHPLP